MNHGIRYFTFAALLLFVVTALTSCKTDVSASAGTNSEYDSYFVYSDIERDADPSIGENEVGELVDGNSEFAFHLYQWLVQSNDNLIFSPFSISVALAMTYAGAVGQTKEEMAGVLNFTLDDASLHPAFNNLDLTLSSLGDEIPRGYENATPFTLNITNSIWMEQTFDPNPDFLDTLSQNYGAGLALMDFINDPDGSTGIINGWINDKTEGRIRNAIPQGAITPATAMALVNAIYFLANWAEQFSESNTRDETFHSFADGDFPVPMMHMEHDIRYCEGDNWQAIEMPYIGWEASMIVLLPAEGEFGNVEEILSPRFFTEIIDSFNMRPVDLTFPKFEYETSLELSEILSQMGMPSAFMGGFSNMVNNAAGDLFISSIIHKAFVAVDEEGTEAAAVTVVIMMETTEMPDEDPPEPVEFKADRPFIYFIVERSTRTILFMGRVMNPSV